MADTVRVLVPRENMNENVAVDYRVVEKNRERAIVEVPEEDAERVARELGGLVEISE